MCVRDVEDEAEDDEELLLDPTHHHVTVAHAADQHCATHKDMRVQFRNGLRAERERERRTWGRCYG
jgi:hypothetical protein